MPAALRSPHVCLLKVDSVQVMMMGIVAVMDSEGFDEVLPLYSQDGYVE